MKKKNLLPVLVALFAFGVQTQNIVAGPGPVISSPVDLNTDSLSSFLDRYARLSHSDRETLRSTPEYKGVAEAVKALSSTDTMKLDLTQMVSAMENFMRHVEQKDDFAKVIDDLYWQAYKNSDVRNVTGFWDKSGAESLKNNFNMMKEIEKGTFSYDCVKWFCQKLSKTLMSFIVEYKDGADFAAEAIKSRKFYSSDLSYNAQSKIKDFEKKLESNAAAEKITAEKNAETAMKSSTMEQLAEKYVKEYVNNYSERGKVQLIFDEKFDEEKRNLGKAYILIPIEKLMELQDELYKKIKNSSDLSKSLHEKWLEAQLEEAEEVLLSKLLLNPEMVEELGRRNKSSDRVLFFGKLNDFVKNNSSKFRDYYTKEYGEKSYDDLVNLKSTLDSKTSDALRQNLPQYWMIREQLKVIEELVVKKKSHGLSAQEDVMQPTRPQKSIRVGKPEPLSDMDDDADEMENVVGKETRMSLEELTVYLKQILGKKWERGIDQALNDDEGLSERIVDTKKQSIFKALLKVKPSVFLDKLGTETKYSFLHQFNLMAFTDKQDNNALLNCIQGATDLRIHPLIDLNAAVDLMYQRYVNPEHTTSHSIIKWYCALCDNTSLSEKKLKKDVLLKIFKNIGSSVRSFKEHDFSPNVKVWDKVKNIIKNRSKEQNITSRMIQNNLKISGMDENDQDYRAAMMLSDLLDANDKKKGAIKKRSISQPKNNRSSSSPKRNSRRSPLRDGAGSAA